MSQPNDPVQSLRELNCEARRQRILAAARTLIARGGIPALSMRKLAQEAGVSVTTLYNLFGVRDDILSALVHDAIDRIDQILQREAPLDVVRAEGRMIVDRFGGESVIVLIDPENFVLTAFRTEARSGEWDDNVLRLSDDTYVEGGVLRDSSGDVVADSRPLQVFTRWYGFSLTFPHTEIYGEG